MKIWICIPVFNRIGFTAKCLESLKSQTNQSFKVVICDHGSTDGTTDWIQSNYSDVIVISADNSLWWTGAINVCVRYVLENAAADDCLLTLNNDTELDSEYIDEMVSLAAKHKRAVLSSAIYDIKGGNLVTAGFYQNWLLAKAKPLSFETDHVPDDDALIAVTHASGRGTMFPLEVFRTIGTYDEKHLPHYGADYDFSHKARRAGFPIYVSKRCKVYSHIELTGMTVVRSEFSLKGFVNYLTSIRSPANISVRFWYGWNNCPRYLLVWYLALDFTRIVLSYVKYFGINTISKS